MATHGLQPKTVWSPLITTCRGVSGQKCFFLKMCGSLLRGSGGCPPGNVFRNQFGEIWSQNKTLWQDFLMYLYVFVENEFNVPIALSAFRDKYVFFAEWMWVSLKRDFTFRWNQRNPWEMTPLNMAGVSSASSSHIAIRGTATKIKLPIRKILLLGALTEMLLTNGL